MNEKEINEIIKETDFRNELDSKLNEKFKENNKSTQELESHFREEDEREYREEEEKRRIEDARVNDFHEREEEFTVRR